jgi:hypothetical protein
MANKPLSREFLLNRGYCCGNGCLNCPYKKKSMNIQEQLSYGQNLVGLTFNPSGDPKVQKAKELCAELADLIQRDLFDRIHSENPPNDLYKQLHAHAIGEILNAQMNAVKLLTLK